MTLLNYVAHTKCQTWQDKMFYFRYNNISHNHRELLKIRTLYTNADVVFFVQICFT